MPHWARLRWIAPKCRNFFRFGPISDSSDILGIVCLTAGIHRGLGLSAAMRTACAIKGNGLACSGLVITGGCHDTGAEQLKLLMGNIVSSRVTGGKEMEWDA